MLGRVFGELLQHFTRLRSTRPFDWDWDRSLGARWLLDPGRQYFAGRAPGRLSTAIQRRLRGVPLRQGALRPTHLRTALKGLAGTHGMAFLSSEWNTLKTRFVTVSCILRDGKNSTYEVPFIRLVGQYP